MSNLIASFNKNTLKVTVNDKDGLKKAMVELPEDVVKDSDILDIDLFSSALTNLVDTLQNFNRKKAEITFLVQPSDVVLRFLTVSKSQQDLESSEHLVSLIKERIKEINLEEYFFSYQKIAPFVYQFVAIRKATLERYIDVANKAELSLKAVVPWDLLLPKFLNSNDPCVFLVRDGKEYTLALSELNGIYFTETYDSMMTGDELRDLIEKLSVYKRTRPIKNIYTITDKDFKLEGYNVEPLLVLISDYRDAEGYEVHLLAEEVMNSNPEYYSTQVNLLTLLPLPVEIKKNLSAVYAGVGGVVLLLLVGVGIYSLAARNDNGSSLTDTADAPVVLSEQERPVPEQPQSPEVQEKPKEDLKKADIRLRVLNGAGIPGVAGDMEGFLINKGYVVEDIGNADTQDYTGITVLFKSEARKYADLLTVDLKESDDSVVVDSEEVAADEPYDALIIVGVAE